MLGRCFYFVLILNAKFSKLGRMPYKFNIFHLVTYAHIHVEQKELDGAIVQLSNKPVVLLYTKTHAYSHTHGNF